MNTDKSTFGASATLPGGMLSGQPTPLGPHRCAAGGADSPPHELDKAIELLPCPFCGAQPVLKIAGRTKYWWIDCEISLDGTNKGCGVSYSSYDKLEAVAKWNNQPAAKRLKEVEATSLALSNAELLGETERCQFEAIKVRLKEVEKERDDALSMWTKKHDDRLEELGRLLEIHSKQTQQLSRLGADYEKALEAIEQFKDDNYKMCKATLDLFESAISTPSAIAMKGETK